MALSRPSGLSTIPFATSHKRAGLAHIVSAELSEKAEKEGVKPNPNYKGELTEQSIEMAKVEQHENCAIHVNGLPGNVSAQEFLSYVHTGKVFLCTINPPDEEIETSAARLVFTTRSAAERFLAEANGWGGIRIRGLRIGAMWDRSRWGPAPEVDKHQTRVLQILGPNKPKFNVDYVTAIFKKDIDFEYCGTREWARSKEQKVVEICFSSILGQSRQALKYFKVRANFDGVEEFFEVKYGPDPCDGGNPDIGRDMFDWPTAREAKSAGRNNRGSGSEGPIWRSGGGDSM